MATAEPYEPETFRHQAARLGSVRERRAGRDEGWTAQVVLYDAPRGLTSDAWRTASPDTVFSWLIQGSPARCEWGPRRGQWYQPDPSTFGLIAEGAPNHFSAPAGQRFAQMHVPPALFDVLLAELAPQRRRLDVLRDDLIGTSDAALRAMLDSYVDRAFQEPTRLEMETRAVLIIERLVSRHLLGRAASAAPPALDWRVRRAVELLDARLDEDVGLESLAQEVGVTARHFARLFRTATGLPPHRWLIGRRLARARMLLDRSGQSVTEIALACGFASSQHFATTFRTHHGLTPLQYRKTRRG